ncbi:glutamine--tRNA ligase/YqeY domain fusion protein [Aureliella helgolandensis]|uniref:Glutamine--tRNA ligase n=1 Tax=Aureliella helgolandensis TaxID=2527968 RepID=A0A518GG92_9BACT|nr:glutamine--tRNA ligase/YqeY domain fusion protein [Aureliella helgolandensis]QDV27603.1 Glutamine--tRNA ligase [Aureliella helgolandensis]
MSHPGNSPENSDAPEIKRERLNFIEQEAQKDLQLPKLAGRCLTTRFPPEPNGYLHIGHAKSICLNFGLAKKYGGRCNLRFDDTNPSKEEQEYVDSIQEDVRWLGYEWDELHYASDYFDQLYAWAVQLIKSGKAFVCDLTGEQVREYRGTLTSPGKPSPYRDRSVEENLELFEGMKSGEVADGARTLRAKIDMSAPNINLRDPVMYRVLRAHHHRTGDKWCIYPMYDWAHGQSDSLEGITHSICTLEFTDHRPLYDWFCENLEIYHPRQIEFARLNLSFTVMSKRKLLQLVKEKHVLGWDDPRMPTISGLRRRGYTAESLRNFCERIGVAKFFSTIDVGVLENAVRDHLNTTANRVMAVLDPIKVVLTNYPADQVEQLEAVNNPEDASAGTREVPFSRELYIERDDFMEDAPRKFFRLKPGGEVRLRYGYIIKCDEVIKDPATGEVTELHCSYDPETRSGSATATQRKVKGTIHWVSAPHALQAEVRLYDRLFLAENPEDAPEGKSFLDNLNTDSLQVVRGFVEPWLASAQPGERVQFERTGYFCVDSKDSQPDGLVFNRIVPLRDSWAKMKAQG